MRIWGHAGRRVGARMADATLAEQGLACSLLTARLFATSQGPSVVSKFGHAPPLDQQCIYGAFNY